MDWMVWFESTVGSVLFDLIFFFLLFFSVDSFLSFDLFGLVGLSDRLISPCTYTFPVLRTQLKCSLKEYIVLDGLV
jgi:hypothetical protein